MWRKARQSRQRHVMINSQHTLRALSTQCVPHKSAGCMTCPAVMNHVLCIQNCANCLKYGIKTTTKVHRNTRKKHLDAALQRTRDRQTELKKTQDEEEMMRAHAAPATHGHGTRKAKKQRKEAEPDHNKSPSATPIDFDDDLGGGDEREYQMYQL
jgi:hypothetical protein